MIDYTWVSDKLPEVTYSLKSFKEAKQPSDMRESLSMEK